MAIAIQLEQIRYEVIRPAPDMTLLLLTDEQSGIQIRLPLSDEDVEGVIRKLRGGNNVVVAPANALPKE